MGCSVLEMVRNTLRLNMKYGSYFAVGAYTFVFVVRGIGAVSSTVDYL